MSTTSWSRLAPAVARGRYSGITVTTTTPWLGTFAE
jgi:hypothetical protein